MLYGMLITPFDWVCVRLRLQEISSLLAQSSLAAPQMPACSLQLMFYDMFLVGCVCNCRALAAYWPRAPWLLCLHWRSLSNPH